MTTFASNFGEQYEHWNGVDLTVNARLPQGAAPGRRQHRPHLRGGLRGRQEPPEATPAAAARQQRPVLPDAVALPHPGEAARRLHAALRHPAVGDVPDQPGTRSHGERHVRQRARLSPSLGRNLSTGASVDVGLVEPKTEYGERLYQLDFRFAKRFNVNRTRFQATLDLFNALNGNPVLVQSNTYGATTGAAAGVGMAATAGDPPGPRRQVWSPGELLNLRNSGT